MNKKEITITIPRRNASLLWGAMKIMFEMQLAGKFEMSRETSVVLQGTWTDLAHLLDNTNKPILEDTITPAVEV